MHRPDFPENPRPDFPELTLLKIVIRGQAKEEFLQVLRTMNITAEALFPGLDGLGRSVEEMLRYYPGELEAHKERAIKSVIAGAE